MHNYSGWSDKRVYPANAMTIMDTEFNLSTQQSLTQQASKDVEPWPSHNLMPILVYIGDK